MGLENAPEAKLIRQTVFVDEQGFKNEFDDTDNKAYHGIITDNGEPVSTGRLFTENGDYHIGRIAVMKPYRGKGLGREIVSLLESKISELADDGMTMVVVTHEMGFAREVASRVMFMADGVIMEQNPPKEFFENPHNPRLKEFLSKVL